jgi:hypothetical protein
MFRHQLQDIYYANDRYDAIRASGQTVIIDGLCLSACTMVLGAVSHNLICVTSQANLGFHAAYNLGTEGRYQPRSFLATLFALFVSSSGLDRRARRLEIPDDVSTRQGADEHVPPLLSQRPGVAPLNAARPARVHLWRCTCPGCNATTTVTGGRGGKHPGRQGGLAGFSWSTLCKGRIRPPR